MTSTAKVQYELTFVDDINPNILCCICQYPFTEPMTTPCGHTFCKECLERALQVMKVCPIDRIPITMDQIRSADPIVRDIVNELRVKCPNHTQGCQVILSRQDVQHHLRTSCSITTEPCPNQGCQERGEASEMQRHQLNCVYRLVTCKDCQSTMTSLDLKKHDCQKETRCCPYCFEEFSLDIYQSHMDTCMDAPTHCRFIELGCDWQGTKRMLEEHERTCILGHVGRLLEQQQRRQEALEIENARLLERVQQLEVETGAMREELQALREMISLSPLSPNGIRLEEQQHLMMNETDQLRQDIAALSATVQSIEMKQDQQVNHELVCQKKDIQILRELYQSLALQVRRMHRIRRTPIESDVHRQETKL